jgi:molybdate transport system substrate-binding protein
MRSAKAVVKCCAATIVLLLVATQVMAGEVRIAAASNFADAIKEIAHKFEVATGHKVVLVFSSTGKHYAQIKNGAPFSAFFAADVRRPKLLEEEGLTVPGSRYTYALGRVVLWSPKANYVDSEGQVLSQGDFRYLAVANPKLAPYGRAAQEVLRSRGLWDDLHRRMVRGENIGQTYQFVKSGNAELGFVALSQIRQPGQQPEGSYWEVPLSLYQPIEQQAVLLQEDEVARGFLWFVKSEASREIIRGYGYGTP